MDEPWLHLYWDSKHNCVISEWKAFANSAEFRAGVMKGLLAVWEFIAGDDWRTALGVVLALAITALIATTSVAAWWVMPIAVLGLLGLSLRRSSL